MVITEKLKDIIKSKKYSFRFEYIFNYLSYDKRITRIDFDYISYSNFLYCDILIYNNKLYNKTFILLIKLK